MQLHTYWNGKKYETWTTLSTDKDMEQQERSYIPGGDAKLYSRFGRQLYSFLQKNKNVSYKISLATWSSNHTSRYLLLKEVEKLIPHENLYPYTDAYGSFIHNCQNWEAAKMSFSRQMHK